MMANPIVFTITSAGKQAIASGAVKLSQVVIGTGTQTLTGNEAALSAETGSAPITSGGVEPQSKILRFSAMLSINAAVGVHEIGIKTNTGILFAVALSGLYPFFSLNAGKFAASFGISLADVAAERVTILASQDENAALVAIEGHLANANPHPQYLSITHITHPNPHGQYAETPRMQALLAAMFPIGYVYHTHNDDDPTPLFDELLGVATAWRRITGYIIVGADPADRFIESPQFNLGQKGLVSDPIAPPPPVDPIEPPPPSVYPLHTTHIWERTDINAVKYDGRHKYDGAARYQ